MKIFKNIMSVLILICLASTILSIFGMFISCGLTIMSLVSITLALKFIGVGVISFTFACALASVCAMVKYSVKSM